MIVCLIDDQIILYHSDVQHNLLSFFIWGGHLVKRLFLDLGNMKYTKKRIKIFGGFVFHSDRLRWYDIKFTGCFKRCNFRLFQYLYILRCICVLCSGVIYYCYYCYISCYPFLAVILPLIQSLNWQIQRVVIPQIWNVLKNKTKIIQKLFKDKFITQSPISILFSGA